MLDFPLPSQSIISNISTQLTKCQYFLQEICMKINKIAPDDNIYLQRLCHIDDAPHVLYCMGILPTKRVPTLAIVGTRKPTRYGIEVTTKFAGGLARQGIIIVSGLALGVDALAHRACLEAEGTTIAVIANQLPDIYPAANRALGERIIAQGGAILSEHCIDEPKPYVVGKWSFLTRNRLVSGLADAILITEAAARSGTLNPAAHALAQGREVFVVPGNITSLMSAGCNALIRQGATPVTSPDDIIAVLLPHEKARQSTLPRGATPAETAIIKQLAAGIRDGDEIQRATSLNAVEFSTTLTLLEINGVIRSLGANQWTLR